MTIDSETANIPMNDLGAAKQALFEAMRQGKVGAPLLRSLLANVSLTAEQQTFVDLLCEMDDQRRRYYRITDFGWRVAGAEAERLSELVETARARKLLGGRGPSAPEGI